MKRVGFGSISLFLYLFGIIFSFTFKGFTLGDIILRKLNLPAWSDAGFHYTVLYSAVIIITALVIGSKYPDDLFSIKFKANVRGVVILSVAVILSLLNLLG